MATLAEFTIPADAFPLGSIFTNHPGVTVELERVVPVDDMIIPYIWVRGVAAGEKQQLRDEVRQHPDVAASKLIDTVDDEFLLRVEWRPEYQGLMKAISETNVTLLSGVGSADKWGFEVRGDDREDVAEFQRYCREHDIPITLTTLHTLTTLRGGTEYDLTDTQYEALVLAYERGFFESPRRASLEEIAEELGITRQSLASRLRRGHQRLIRNTLISPDGT